MSRFAKVFISAVLLIAFCTVSLTALGADGTHKHTYYMTGVKAERVLFSDTEECATEEMYEYKCTQADCGSVIYAPVPDSYRHGPHKFIFSTSHSPGGDVGLPVLTWTCEYCGYFTNSDPNGDV